MARETSTATLLLLALTLQSPAWAQIRDAQCPQPAAAEAAEPASDTAKSADTDNEPVTIEADDKDFSFDVNGNAVLSGNVVMRQGNKVIRAARLEYNSKTGHAKVAGTVG